MSTSAVHQRVRRLEQRGVVKGYTAKLDHTALGQQMTAFISITPLDPAAPDDIPERLHEVPQIEECHSVAGDENYILKVRVATPVRARGADRHRPRRRQRLDPHDGRALDAVGVSGPDRPVGRPAALPPAGPRRPAAVPRRGVGVRRPTPAGPLGHQPARPGQARGGVELGYLVVVGRARGARAAVERGRLGLGGRRHVGARRESREYLVDLYRSVWALTDAADRRAAARRPGHRGLVAGGAPRDDLRAPARARAWPRPRSTPGTPTSCARGSTARAGATTTTMGDAATLVAVRGARSSRRPTSTGRCRGRLSGRCRPRSRR